MTTAPPPPTASRCPPAANNAYVFIGTRPSPRSRLPSSPPYPSQESTVPSSNLNESAVSDATAVTAHTALSDATAKNALIDAIAATAVSDATYATAHTTLSDDDATSKPHQAHDSLWAHIRAVRDRDGELGPRQFRPMKKLGFGDIGRVYLAELRGTGSLFALKVMTKAELKCGGKLGRAQTELEILRQLDHPFLPTLYCDFETVNHSCLVMDYCSGGNLHRLRQVQPGKCFPESVARFYAAEVLLALEYLHMLGIVYRDLKPENVLIRENGHIMLSDFDLSSRGRVSPVLIQASKKDMGHLKGSAHCDQLPCIKPWSCMEPSCFSPSCLTSRSKRDRRGSSPSRQKSGAYNQVIPLLDLVAEPTNALSMSFVGTHEYLAPEIFRGEGHGSAVDWWALGIFLYELLFGRTPFKGHGSHATMFNVIGEPLKFPNSPSVSVAAKGLISSLLVKEPQKRLASRRGVTEVKQHPFFESINWGLIRCTTSREVVKQVMLDLLKGS